MEQANFRRSEGAGGLGKTQLILGMWPVLLTDGETCSDYLGTWVSNGMWPYRAIYRSTSASVDHCAVIGRRERKSLKKLVPVRWRDTGSKPL